VHIRRQFTFDHWVIVTHDEKGWDGGIQAQIKRVVGNIIKNKWNMGRLAK
jgi:hypothetical protein